MSVSTITSFRDLVAWQNGMELASAIHLLAAGFPKEEMFEMSNQLRRASVGIPTSIAEGEGRMTRMEFLQYLGVARGLNYEVQTLLELARNFGFGGNVAMERCQVLSNEVDRTLNGLISSVTEGNDRATCAPYH